LGGEREIFDKILNVTNARSCQILHYIEGIQII